MFRGITLLSQRWGARASVRFRSGRLLDLMETIATGLPASHAGVADVLVHPDGFSNGVDRNYYRERLREASNATGLGSIIANFSVVQRLAFRECMQVKILPPV